MTTSSQEVAQIAVTALTEAREHAHAMIAAHQNEITLLKQQVEQLQADILRWQP